MIGHVVLKGAGMTASKQPVQSVCASPPCFAHELADTGNGMEVIDPQQALDLSRWRQSKRKELLGARAALSVSQRDAMGRTISNHVIETIKNKYQNLEGKILSLYWPIKSELDLRETLSTCLTLGMKLALPVVGTKNAPLAFYAWKPGDKMERGFWNIPVPAKHERVTPDILLAPLVGWDNQNFRLGYGGGYFDRTLAAFTGDRFVIGVGLSQAKLDTIFPQPYDQPLDMIITEHGIETHGR